MIEITVATVDICRTYSVTLEEIYQRKTKIVMVLIFVLGKKRNLIVMVNEEVP